MAEWYYSVGDGQQRGPVDAAGLKRLADGGRLSPSNLVWREGMTEWAPASKVKGLFPGEEPPPLKPSSAGMASDFEPFPHAQPGPATRRDYAGFGSRAVAFLIDSAILMFGSVAIIGVGVGMLMSLGGGKLEGQNIDLYFFGIYLIAWLAIWLYHALMESSNHQATLGKMAMGLKVTDLDGRRIGFGRATGRTFGKVLSSLFWGVGFLMAGFTERKQALHDILAGTLVVRG